MYNTLIAVDEAANHNFNQMEALLNGIESDTALRADSDLTVRDLEIRKERLEQAAVDKLHDEFKPTKKSPQPTRHQEFLAKKAATDEVNITKTIEDTKLKAASAARRNEINSYRYSSMVEKARYFTARVHAMGHDLYGEVSADDG